MFDQIVVDILQPVLVLLLLVVVEADQGGQALVALEQADLVVQQFDLLGDVLLDGLGLFGLVDRALPVLLLHFLDQLELVLLENLFNPDIDFLLTLGELLMDVALQPLPVLDDIILD